MRSPTPFVTGPLVPGPLVTVCRGCCCGTAKKHPGVDHDALLDQLATDLGDAARIRTSDCIDACAQSNVVVVGPSAAGRLAGGRPVWLAGVLDERRTAALAEWVRRGGPGLADPGPELTPFRPSRDARAAIRRA